MTAQELKNSILQLAVQGKLVPQDPNDEPASVLLSRIRQEKSKLVQAGTIKKEKPLPPIESDELPFEIPDSWEWVRLGEVIILTSGQDLSTDKYNDRHEGIPYITGASNITESSVIINRWTQQPTSIACYGDLLLTCKGTVGKIAKVKEDSVHIARQIMGIRSIGDMYTDYLKFFLEYSVPSFKINAKSQIPGIGRDIVLSVFLPLPPLSEQRRIVERIEELLPIVERYGEAEEELRTLNVTFPDQLRKSILQQAVQGKLVPQDPNDEPASVLLSRIRQEKSKLVQAGKIKKEKPLPPIDPDELPFEIPNSWEWVRLGEVCTKIGAGSTPSGGSAVYVSSGIKFLREQNVQDNGLLLDNVVYIDQKTDASMSGSRVKAKDILMNITGASIGRNSLVPDDFDSGNVNQHVLIIRLIDTAIRFYLHLCFCSPTIINQMLSKQVGDKPGLSATKVKNFVFPLPPLSEQRRIVERIEELLSLCTALTASVS